MYIMIEYMSIRIQVLTYQASSINQSITTEGTTGSRTKISKRKAGRVCLSCMDNLLLLSPVSDSKVLAATSKNRKRYRSPVVLGLPAAYLKPKAFHSLNSLPSPSLSSRPFHWTNADFACLKQRSLRTVWM